MASTAAGTETTMTAKIRLDQLLVERGLADSRAKAQALILAGQVRTGGHLVGKPGHMVRADLLLDGVATDAWVSRGAHKLIAGLTAFGIDPDDKVALDIGASTGGFTEVLLSRGAVRVFAIDVGHGQLAWTLRNNPHVTVLERTNARHLTSELITTRVDLIVCDVSFISLTLALPAALALARPGAELVALVKPQFEAGRGQVGKGGVVRDAAVHAEVVARVTAWVAGQGWTVLGTVESPLRGPAGNIEFLLGARAPPIPGDPPSSPPCG